MKYYTKIFFAAPFIAIILGFLLLSCAPRKQQGMVRLHTSVPVDLVENIRLAFEHDYPHITVDVVRSGTRAIVEGLLDRDTGTAGADVVWVADFAATEELKKHSLLQRYVSVEAKKIPPIFKDSEGYYTGSRLLSMVVVYNTKYVKEKPKSYHDLLAPTFKGRVALVDPKRSGSSLYTMEVLLADSRYGWEFFYKLYNDQSLAIADNNSVLTERIAGGEYWIGIALDFSVRSALRDAPTLPVGYVFPADGVVAIPSPIAVSCDCANLKSSKLFVDWILSQKGQKLLSEKLGITPVRLDVGVPEGMVAWDHLAIIPSDAGEIVQRRQNSIELLSDIFTGKEIEELNVVAWK